MTSKPSQTQPVDAHGSTSIWDNDLPVGDSPPLPRWPLTAAIVAYCVWMVFLVGMMILRLKESAG